MALFKAKTKDIEEYETEIALPSFKIDTNGFIMFDDPSLGGACVLEVFPHVSTEGITHEDPVYHNECTEFSTNPTYEPSTNALFANVRHRVYPGWVNFLNSLQALDESDEPTHLQILMKKCRADEWYTRMDYACYTAHKEFDAQAKAKMTARDPRKALLGARTQDYLDLLESVNDKIKNIPETSRDVRKMAGYKMKFYIIISYTPSSEGWWLDGRDSDYYISDHASPFLAFAGSQDKLVDRLTDMIFSRAMKKQSGSVPEGGQEDDFFWIESDRTAQILATRVHKMMTTVKKWNKENKNLPLTFHMKKLSDRETAALVRFFPNILTPYWDKIWSLQSDQNDMLYSFDVQHAIEMGDLSLLDQDGLFDDIMAERVDMRHSKDEQEAFLAKFKDKNFDEIGDLRSDYDDRFWSPEKEEEDAIRAAELAEAQANAHNLWSDFSDMFALDETEQTQQQKRDEFLKQYKTRGRGTPLSENKKDKKQ